MMQTTTYKHKLFLPMAILALVGILSFGYQVYSATTPEEETKLGAIQALDVCNDLGSATTSYTNWRHLSPTAATTTINFGGCNIGKVDLVDMNWFLEASSTGVGVSSAVVTFTREFSMDNSDFFAETITTAEANNVTRTLGSGSAVTMFRPVTNATTTLNQTINPIAAKFVRINIASRQATSSIWVQIVRRSVNN